jgi:hypothetical protein
MSHILSPPHDRDSEAEHRRTEGGSTLEERSDEDRGAKRSGAEGGVDAPEYGGRVDAAERATPDTNPTLITQAPSPIALIAMATYTTFFAATPAELRDALPGWFEALATPVKRTMINPFTNQPREYDSHAPDEAFRSEPSRPPRKTSVTGTGDYGDYLQSRLPHGIQALPNLPLKGVLRLHAEDLLDVIAVGTEDPALGRGLIPPGGDQGAVSLAALPDWSTSALAKLTESDIARACDALIANVDTWFAQEDWKLDGIARVLRDLRELAKRAGTRRLWLLTEA